MNKNEPPIRVLHVVTAMNMAGTEVMLMNLHRCINRDIIQFDYAVCSEEKCAFDDEILALGGKIYHYPKYKIINHFKYVKWWNNFFREHKNYRIIHGHVGSTAAIYLGLAKKYGYYAIAHSHNTYGNFNIRMFVYWLFSYRTRYIADYFFGCSEDALVSRFGRKILSNSCHQILPNAIDVSKFQFDENKRMKIRTELGISKNEFVIGTIGRLTIQKNPEKILSIIKNLYKRKINFKLLWIGAGELKTMIINEINRSNLNANIILIESRDDIPDLLSAMDIFIFPSKWEGLGVAAIEAQVAGLPIICSTVVPKEVRLADDCYFLPLNDDNSWENLIIKLSNRKKRNRSTLNRMKASDYNILITAQKMTDFYLNKYKKISAI